MSWRYMQFYGTRLYFDKKVGSSHMLMRQPLFFSPPPGSFSSSATEVAMNEMSLYSIEKRQINVRTFQVWYM